MEDPPMLQHPAEIERLLNLYVKLNPQRVLEIGSLFGGTLKKWIEFAPVGAIIVSVDVIPNPDYFPTEDILHWRSRWPVWARKARVNLETIYGNSNNNATVERVSKFAPFDFIFVDGGHEYATVANDYAIYSKLLRADGVIAFHDIAYPNRNDRSVDVGRWWRNIKKTKSAKMEEILRHPDQKDWGIGIIRK